MCGSWYTDERDDNDADRSMVGGVAVGGGAPVSIQSMCNTATEDVEATVAADPCGWRQAGCEIIRVAVPDGGGGAGRVGRSRRRIRIPLVADIHFDYKLALECSGGRGIDKIRINPGNIGGRGAGAGRGGRLPRSGASPSASASTAARWKRSCWPSTAASPRRRWWRAPWAMSAC